MPLTENSYGFLKRFTYIAEAIITYQPATVLDIGCGTGNNLSTPLAARFPQIKFTAIDTDPTSIVYAQKNNQNTNISFIHKEDLSFTERFDLVILSEVLEHIDDPEEFLKTIRALLNKEGKLILTTPNGYGPFEFTAFLELLLYFLIPRKRPAGIPPTAAKDSDTLAISPHVNFFSYRQLNSLVRRVGFKVIKFRPRTFLCGYIFDRIITRLGLVSWNSRVADKLPAAFASDWMFIMEPAEPDPTIAQYRRNFSGHLRRNLTLKRNRQ